MLIKRVNEMNKQFNAHLKSGRKKSARKKSPLARHASPKNREGSLKTDLSKGLSIRECDLDVENLLVNGRNGNSGKKQKSVDIFRTVMIPRKFSRTQVSNA